MDEQRLARIMARLPLSLKQILKQEISLGNEVVELEKSHDATTGRMHLTLRLNHPFRATIEPLPTGVIYRAHEDSDPMRYEFGMQDSAWSLATCKFKPWALPSLPTGVDEIEQQARAQEIVRKREEAAAMKRVAPSTQDAIPAFAANFSQAARDFLVSMPMTYEAWHDGTGYNLEALSEVAPEERSVIATHILAHQPRDWRDIEAMAQIDSVECRAAVEQALHSGDILVRQEAMKHAGDKIDPAAREKHLIIALQSATFLNGLGAAIDEGAAFHPPGVVRALLQAARHREGDVAVNCAAVLFYIFGKSQEPFDWAHRPFFLQFQTTDRQAREKAFAELCRGIGVDVKSDG